MKLQDQPEQPQEPEEKSGCGTIGIAILIGLFIFGFMDRAQNPPNPLCAYGVEFC